MNDMVPLVNLKKRERQGKGEWEMQNSREKKFVVIMMAIGGFVHNVCVRGIVPR